MDTMANGTLDILLNSIEDNICSYFDSCDPMGVGQVRISTLVHNVHRLMGKYASKKSQDDLWRRLNLSKDDCQIDRDNFKKIAVVWMNDELGRADEDKGSSRQRERAAPVKIEQVLGSTSPLKSLSSQDIRMEGSVEGIGGGDVSLLDCAELTTELNELRSNNKKLSKENECLLAQASALEEEVEQLKDEISVVRQRAGRLQTSLIDATKFKDLDNEVRSSSFQEGGAQDREESSIEKIKELLQENCKLQKELCSAQESLVCSRQNAKEASALADQHVKEKEQQVMEIIKLQDLTKDLRGQLQSLSKELDEAKGKNLELEDQITLLQDENHSHEEFIKEAYSKNSKNFEAELSHDLLDMTDHFVWNNLNSSFGSKHDRPKAMSTPSVKNGRPQRSSIGDELKEQGFFDFCDKSNRVKAGECSHLAASPPKKDTSVQADFSVPPVTFCQQVLRILLFFTFAIACFTFLGAVEIDGTTFYPITWSADLGLPEPVIAFRYESSRESLVW